MEEKIFRKPKKEDLWGIYVLLAKQISESIKMFVEQGISGVPFCIEDCLTDEDWEFSYDLWFAILWKMVDGFSRISKDDSIFRDEYNQEALDLFAEFFMNLWD